MQNHINLCAEMEYFNYCQIGLKANELRTIKKLFLQIVLKEQVYIEFIEISIMYELNVTKLAKSVLKAFI